MGLFDIFGRKRREEERRRREAMARPSYSSTPSRSAWDDSPMNPTSPSGMILSPLSPISSSFGVSDYSPSDSCSASSSYSDSGSSCSGGDSGGGGGGD
ncbi:putative membrane protein YgcG [Methylobacterium sp. RAS18]|nr:putative membrane protein YgcG [Methylobacterium sp. RAS18]